MIRRSVKLGMRFLSGEEHCLIPHISVFPLTEDLFTAGHTHFNIKQNVNTCNMMIVGLPVWRQSNVLALTSTMRHCAEPHGGLYRRCEAVAAAQVVRL